MRVLVLSFYYPPDIGPGPLRAESIVQALREKDKNISIDVITTMPNRYSSLNIDCDETHQDLNSSVKRISLPKHNSGMKNQAYAFYFFARGVFKAIKKQKYDLVLATSSRLMTAFLGALIAKRAGAKLYLDIRDLFTDTMKDVLINSPMKLLLPIFKYVEKWTFKSASMINIVSGGFVQHIKAIAPSIELTIYTNGVDDVFVNTDFSSEKNHVPKILYAGNLGEGQGLDNVIPNVAKSLGGEVVFVIFGDGGKRKELETKIEAARLTNVTLSPPIEREQLFEEYKNADILFLHLNDYAAFKKVLPSKIFEYAATGKPIVAGVGGYAAKFIRENIPGATVFQPNNEEHMISAIKTSLKSENMFDRDEFLKRYIRKNIMRKMAEDIYDLGLRSKHNFLN